MRLLPLAALCALLASPSCAAENSLFSLTLDCPIHQVTYYPSSHSFLVESDNVPYSVAIGNQKHELASGQVVHLEKRDACTGEVQIVFPMPEKGVDRLDSISISPDGLIVVAGYGVGDTVVASTYIGSGQNDLNIYRTPKRLVSWDAQTGQILWKVPLVENTTQEDIGNIQWTPDSKFLLVDSQVLRLVDARTGEMVREIAHSEEKVKDIGPNLGEPHYTEAQLIAGGTQILTYRENGKAATRVRDLKGELLEAAPSEGNCTKHPSKIGGRIFAQFSVYQQKLPHQEDQDDGYIYSPWGKRLVIYDATTGKKCWQIPLNDVEEWKFDEKYQRLATISDRCILGQDGLPEVTKAQLNLWDVATKKRLLVKEIHPYSKFQFSSDSQSLMVVYSVHDPKDQLGIRDEMSTWNAITGQFIGKKPVHGDELNEHEWDDSTRLIPSPDGAAVIAFKLNDPGCQLKSWRLTGPRKP